MTEEQARNIKARALVDEIGRYLSQRANWRTKDSMLEITEEVISMLFAVRKELGRSQNGNWND